MTSTEKVLTGMKERRTEWIAQLVDAAVKMEAGRVPPVVWEAMLDLMLREARELMAPTNAWWLRRIHWIELQRELGRNPAWIMIQALRDMKFSNDNDGR